MSLVKIQTEPLKPLEFGQQGLKTANRGYYVYLTFACNIRCGYCFVSDKDNHSHLSDPISYPNDKEDMAGKIIDFIVNDPEGTESKYIHFFGGEPLIRAKSIPRICSEVQSRLPKCKITWGITTNGTLLTEENCEMLKKYNVGVQLSLDGSEEGNDVHRQLMGGNQKTGNVNGGALRKAGAFKLVKIQNYLKYFGSNCRMTLTPDNLEFLIQSVKELSAMGFKSFSVIPNSDTGDWEGRWQDLEMQLEKLFYLSLEMGAVVNLVDHAMTKVLDRKEFTQSHLCQAGRNVIGISIEGDIWPCHDFLGKYSKDPNATKALQIGHVEKGYTYNTSKFEDLKCDDEVHSGAGFDCKTCHAQSMCDRGCPYINYASQGAVKEVNATYCRSTRMMADIALRYMLRHPEKYTVAKVTAAPKNPQTVSKHVPDYRQTVALAYLEREAPFGRDSNGRATMPGPAKAAELGLPTGSARPPFAGEGSGSTKPVNGPRGAVPAPTAGEQAGWDGERGMPSDFTQPMAQYTMNMVVNSKRVQ